MKLQSQKVYPAIQVRNQSILLYDAFISKPNFTQLQRDIRSKNLQNSTKYSGVVTEGTKKRIARTVDVFLQRSTLQTVFNPILQDVQKFKVNFITLTIPDDDPVLSPSDAYKQLLTPFLRWMKEAQNVKDYIWKYELQQRGQLHYHITTNVFILHDQIRKKWNEIVNKSGLMDKFKLNSGHSNPNSTDIHAVYKVRDIGAYLAKYLSKSENGKVNAKGKIWGCSESLRGVKYFSDVQNVFNSKMLRSLLRERMIEVIKLEKCCVIRCKNFKPIEVLSDTQMNEYNDWLRAV
jgi:hypothetical protein